MYEHIKMLLKERGLSKLQLAMKAGINPSDLYQALSGNKPMYPAYRRKLSEALGVPEAELFKAGDSLD